MAFSSYKPRYYKLCHCEGESSVESSSRLCHICDGLQDNRLPEDSIHDLARDLVKALQ